jgi:two-component system nitrate/nitrite response regulator NarL
VTTTTGGQVTVLIVDDHPLIRHGLTALLELEDWVAEVLAASTAKEALELTVTRSPGLAVVDLGLPDVTGTELITRLRRARPDCGLLVLTMTSEESAVRACLLAGANGYVLKGSAPEVVLRAAQTVADGGLVLGPEVRTGTLIDADAPRLPEPLSRLTDRDLDLLAHLAEGSSNREIARALGVSEKTIRNRMSGVFLTLGVADRVQAALIARDHGLSVSSRSARP